MALTLRYFTEFGKPAFQHVPLPRALNLLIKSIGFYNASRAVKFARVTKFKDFSVTF